jgi:hypothetical protein
LLGELLDDTPPLSPGAELVPLLASLPGLVELALWPVLELEPVEDPAFEAEPLLEPVPL